MNVCVCVCVVCVARKKGRECVCEREERERKWCEESQEWSSACILILLLDACNLSVCHGLLLRSITELLAEESIQP